MTTTTRKAARILVWHRRDLRLHDNPLYQNVLHGSDNVVSLYVFDTRDFLLRPSCAEPTWKTVNTGPYQAIALIDAVTVLRSSLSKIGGRLLVRVGHPEILVPQLVRQLQATLLVFAELPGVYEMKTATNIRLALQHDERVNVHTDCSYTLYHPNDLPTRKQEWIQLAHPKQKQRKKTDTTTTDAHNDSPPTIHPNAVDVSPSRWLGMCSIMGDFRRAARTRKIRPIIPAPTKLSSISSSNDVEDGAIPELRDLYAQLLLQQDASILGMSADKIGEIIQMASSTAATTHAGEVAALDRLHSFVKVAENADRSLADTTTGDDSSKFSLFLALGTLSPRTIVQAAAARECAWLQSHLEMRDFFLYSAFRWDRALFRQEGLPISRNKQVWFAGQSKTDEWKRWALGTTGLPLVDAAMVELRTTGYCSNRVRQNAASLLTKDLHIDWRLGAEWFQFLLGDYCLGANWGNWMYFSGVGSDPKNRHFRTVSQARRYDPQCTYVSKWLCFRDSEIEAKLRPWDFDKDWITPIVDPSTQYTWQDLQKLNETGELGQNHEK